MTPKTRGIRTAIRYSEAFKMEVVREMETTDCTFHSLQLKYRIRGCGTIQQWLAKYGRDKQRGKIIRVEKPGEINELVRLKRELDRVKVALADAHVSLAVEAAYLQVACDRLGESVDGFKKKNVGRRRMRR